jgi:hypothetical protein|tara:strand:+ start:267 stop:476 length:210 start_codon:yes stop_codon:yes gene_type:complete
MVISGDWMELNGVTSWIHAQRKCRACHYPESDTFPEGSTLRMFSDLETLARLSFRVDELSRGKDPGEVQ